MRSPPFTVRFLLILSQLFGASPLNLSMFSPNPLQPATFRVYITNALHLIWSHFILAAMVCCMYLQLGRMASFQMGIIRYLHYCEFVSSLLNCTITMVGSNIQRHKFAAFWSKIEELDTKLGQQLGLKLGELQKMDRRLVLFVWKLYAMAMLLSASTLMVIIVYYELQFCRMLIVWVAYVLPNNILLLTMMQYYSLLFIVRERIDFIVWRLQNVGKIVRTNGSLLAYRKQVAEMCSLVENTRRIYHQLGELEGGIHRAFGWLMISTMMTSILIVTSELYQFYRFVVDIFIGLRLVHSIDWMLLHFGKLFLALYLCTRLNNAKSRVATALHQIRLRDDMNSNGVLATITQFSLQMLHEDRYQTACGILKLDLTLIGSIVSSLTTYLVILIQFDSSLKKNSDNCFSPSNT